METPTGEVQFWNYSWNWSQASGSFFVIATTNIWERRFKYIAEFTTRAQINSKEIIDVSAEPTYYETT